VNADQVVHVPEGNRWATLDSYRGLEHYYFLASLQPRTELEKSMLTLTAFPTRDILASHTRAERLHLASGDTLVRVETPAPARGFGSVRASTVADVENSQGEKFALDAQLYAASGANADVALTRWFLHE
jgi:hypothetical protein